MPTKPIDNLTDFTIESGVPIPPRPLKQRRYPFDQLKVGDCIFVPTPTASFRSYASIWARDHSVKFTTRRDKVGRKDGLRLWRIA